MNLNISYHEFGIGNTSPLDRLPYRGWASSPAAWSNRSRSRGLLQAPDDKKPFFLGLNDRHKVHFSSNGSSSDVIVGVIDTGVWPKSNNFHGERFDPPPRTWKGECKDRTNFTMSLCNRNSSAPDSSIRVSRQRTFPSMNHMSSNLLGTPMATGHTLPRPQLVLQWNGMLPCRQLMFRFQIIVMRN